MRRILLAAVGSLLFGVAALGAGGWEDSFDKALAEAKETGRYVLADFSGSDWCGWCVRLDKEVFSKSEFKKYAKENLVLFIADFPRGKPQSTKLKKQNEELARKYGIRGFPTVLILSPSGDEVGKTGYKPGGPEAYVEHLQKIIAAHKDGAK